MKYKISRVISGLFAVSLSLNIMAMYHQQNVVGKAEVIQPFISLRIKENKINPVDYQVGLDIPAIRKAINNYESETVKPDNKIILDYFSDINFKYDQDVIRDFLQLVEKVKDSNVFKQSSIMPVHVKDEQLESLLRDKPIERLLQIYSLSRKFNIPYYALFNQVLQKKITEKASVLSDQEKRVLSTSLKEYDTSILWQLTDNYKAVLILPKEGSSFVVPVLYDVARLSNFLRTQIELFDSTNDIEITQMQEFSRDIIRKCFDWLSDILVHKDEKFFIDLIKKTTFEDLVQMIRCFDFLDVSVDGYYETHYLPYEARSIYRELSSWRKEVIHKKLRFIYDRIYWHLLIVLVDKDTLEEQKRHIKYIKNNWSLNIIEYLKFIASQSTDLKYQNFINSKFLFLPQLVAHSKKFKKSHVLADIENKIQDNIRQKAWMDGIIAKGPNMNSGILSSLTAWWRSWWK